MSLDNIVDSASSVGESDDSSHDAEVTNDSAPSSASSCDCDGPDHAPQDVKYPTSSPNSAAEWDDLEHDPRVLDVLIIGAGPCGLAAAARIREPAPAAMFTDEEHKRWHWLSKHGKKLALKETKTGNVRPAKKEHEQEYTMAVLDATEDKCWLGRWKDRFATFGIRHLRSPMIWHTDPQEVDSLLRHAERHGTKEDMIEIKGCVGKEKSKYKQKLEKFSGGSKDSKVDINYRYVNDYHRPSQSIFCDHCDSVARHYKLDDGLIHKEIVRDIRYGIADEAPGANNIFTVVTNKSVRYARSVILAVGPANQPVLPKIPSLSYPGKSTDTAMPQACHSMNIQLGQFPDAIVQRRIKDRRSTNILVIGGGLTSAQLADLAIRKGATRVWHMMRGPLKKKHFDVGLDWMGKYKTRNQSAFHQADSDEERMEIITEARNGGSTTPAYHLEVTTPHIKSAKLKLSTNTILTDAHFEGPLDGEGGKWKVKTEPAIEGLPAMDYICFATGIQTDFTTLPYLQNMLQDYPITGVGGYPSLTDDLMWADDVPLFVAGKLAALRLGPAAANIGGARVGAERIALALEEYLSRSGSGRKGFFDSEWDTVRDGERDGELDRFNYTCGVGSMFSCLPEA
ncbi:unnamed protein product [Discula destructiva]